MGTPPASAREVASLDRVDPAVRRFELEWRQGRPDLARHLTDAVSAGSVSLLASLVKVDLRGRFALGERPAVAEYIDRFPELVASGDRVLSLIYEEFCLREERDERPDTAEFCARYEPWKDSLESQLRYHRVLIKVAGPPPTVRFPVPGERFGPFLIGAELGRGRAGRVYLARDESLGGREVALKVSQDRGSEPSTLGRLKHPHIVPVLSVLSLDCGGTNLRGLCMPYQPGLALDEVIRLVDPVSRPARAGALLDALRLAAPGGRVAPGAGWDTFPARGSYVEGVAWVVAVLAEALAHAHAQGIFHRDVKPANILLTGIEGPQLLDFNLAHDPHSAVEAEAALRGGTLPYMAPEQLAAFLDPARWDDVLGQADIYSLGLLLRELLTGRAPEPPDPSLPLPRSIRDLLDHRAAFKPDLRRCNPRVPHALDAIAGRCLAYAPADRYRGAGDLADDLRRFLARRPLKEAHNPSWRERVTNRVVRNRRPVAALIVVAAAIAAAATWWTGSEGPPRFDQAVIELDEGRFESALNILRGLRPRERGLPLVAFYTAAAYARGGRARESDEALERAWRRPEAVADLTAWGRSHPPFVRHAERLAVFVHAGTLRVEPPRKPAMLDRVERTFRLVLRLDPLRYRAREGLAVIDEGRGAYAAAHDVLTASLASLGDRPAANHRLDLATSLVTRARVSTRWARSLLATVSGLAAEVHLREAIGDLDRCDPLVLPADVIMRFEVTYIRCETMLALAEVAAGGGRHARALDFYHQAERLLDTLAARPPQREPAYRTLETKVRERVRTEIPRLKALIPAESLSR